MSQVRPRRIGVEASSFCQLRCPSCPTTSRAIHPAVGSGFLTFDNFRKIVDENPSIAQIELSNYGEIFLNPHLLEIVEYAYRRGVGLTANNGVNLNNVKEEALEGLAKYKFRAMRCSIDGASRETYRLYRVKGSFENVIDNINKLNSYKRRYRTRYPQLVWQFIVFGHNEHEIPQARIMARELGMGFHLKLSWDPELSPVRDKDFVRRQFEFHSASREEFKEKYGVDYLQNVCYALWNKPQINWDGKVLGCSRNFWGEFGGNAFEDGLNASINSEGMQYAREMLQGRRPARDDIPCATCSVYLNRKASGVWLNGKASPSPRSALGSLFRRLGVARLRRRMINRLPI